MAVKKKYDRNVLGRGLDNIGTGKGRGLDALIDTSDVKAQGSSNLSEIALSMISPNPNQPRTDFDEAALQELAASIREIGLITPVTLRQMGENEYQIIAGERRWRAATLAGLTAIPAYIRTAEDEKVMEMALVENIQREDLNPIEEALGYQTLMDKFNMTQEDVSGKIGKSRSAIANSVRLLALDEPIRQKLISGEISSGHARALLAIESPKVRLAVLESIIEKGLNVRQAEALAKQLQKAKPKKKKPTVDEQIKAQLAVIEDRLSSHLGTKVTLLHDNKKGKIEIEYYGNADLDRIISIIEEA